MTSQQERPPAKSAASVVNYANLFRAGPFFVPGTDYDLLRRLGTPTDKQKRQLAWTLKYHPDIWRSLWLHHRALSVAKSDFGRFASSDPAIRGRFDADLTRYLDSFPNLPFAAYFKMLEGQLFNGEPESSFGPGTLEIGVSAGNVSRQHFAGKKIEFGTEYLADRLSSGGFIHEHLFASDLRSLPLSSASLRTVFLVHIFDDLNFDMDFALAEIARVLKAGGRIVFSSASGAYGSHQSREKLASIISLSRGSFERYAVLRYACRNLHDEESLTGALARRGLKLVTYREFLSLEYAWLWDIGMTVEMGIARTALSLLSRRGKGRLYNRYLRFACDALFGLYCYERDNPGQGIHCFGVARLH